MRSAAWPAGSQGYRHMRRAVIGLALLAAWPATTAAQFYTGNDLLQYCQSKSRIEIGICHGIIAGGSDMMKALGAGCQYRNQVTVGQLIDVVTKLLREQPKIRDLPASELVRLALQQSFSCIRNKPAPWVPGAGKALRPYQKVARTRGQSRRSQNQP